MTAQIPAGTVTFLFTDIEGSASLWEREPESMRAALARHDAVLEAAVVAQAGVVYKHIGDAVQAAFALPAPAVLAALAAQRALAAEAWPTSTPIRVRMGLHTGPAVPAGADYATTHTLNRVARIMAAGHGGQVLLSVETANLVRGDLPGDLRLRDLAEHRMKGLAQLEHLYQLVAPDLPADFPPLATQITIPNNLPTPATSFIGRERELAEVKRLLAGTRLLTLTGSGGTGKTRLSLKVAAEVLPEFKDGVWLVELAPLTDPALIPSAVLTVFELREQPGRPPLALVTDYLRAKRLLLILDNCEHLIEACARLTANWLQVCPHLRILASSREALGVAGEAIFHVPSLSLPNTDAATPVAVSGSEAARLFEERARLAQPHFVLNEHNAPAVAQICRRLDGIPLALELAAARLRVFPPEQIAARLDDRFRLLTGGSRTALPRQQTLRALIDWSYDLLPEAERALLCELSVFAGGWTLEAAEAVGSGPDVFDHLARLVDKSLVVMDDQAGAARYRLLETVRQYARDKLFEAGEAARVRGRHLAYFVQLMEAAETRLQGHDMIVALDRLGAELDNLRAALEWALEVEPAAALRMVGAMGDFLGRRASATEWLRWIKAALTRAATVVPDESSSASSDSFTKLRAKALASEAMAAFALGDNAGARDASETAVALAREVDDPFTLARALSVGGSALGFLGDPATGRARLMESLALCRRLSWDFGKMGALATLVFVVEPAERAAIQAESLQVARSLRNPWVMGMNLLNVARVTEMAGAAEPALTLFEEAKGVFEQMRDRHFCNVCLSEIGHLHRHQGQLITAAAVYQKTLRAWHDSGYRAAMAHQLECFAFIAVTQRQAERAATLLGAAEALRAAIGSEMTVFERREYEPAVAQLRTHLDEADFVRAWAAGRALSLEDAVAYALDIASPEAAS